MKVTKKTFNQGFTLIELLVVITIIAILASIAVPVYNNITVRAEQSKALSNAKQIALAAKVFSIDYDGIYPDVATVPTHQTLAGATGSTSTDNFQALINGGYTSDSEEIFFVSKEHAGTTRLTAPDGDTNTPLAATENAWAYVSGLTSTSNAKMPLVVQRNGGGTTWPARGDTGTEGGCWDGRAIVVRNDYAGKVYNIVGAAGAAGPILDAAGVDMFTDTNTYAWGSTGISLVQP